MGDFSARLAQARERLKKNEEKKNTSPLEDRIAQARERLKPVREETIAPQRKTALRGSPAPVSSVGKDRMVNLDDGEYGTAKGGKFYSRPTLYQDAEWMRADIMDTEGALLDAERRTGDAYAALKKAAAEMQIEPGNRLIANAYNDLLDKYKTVYGQYRTVADKYGTQAKDFNSYLEDQGDRYDAWRSTVRGKDYVQQDIDGLNDRIKELRDIEGDIKEFEIATEYVPADQRPSRDFGGFSSIEEVRAEIARLEEQQRALHDELSWSKSFDYETVPQNEDFGSVVDGMRNQTIGWNDLIPDVFKGNVGARSVVGAIQNGTLDTLQEQYGFLTEEQQDILLYYAGRGEWDKATEYLEWAEKGLNQQAAMAQQERVEAFSRENPFWASVLSPAASVLGGVAGAADLLAQTVERGVTGKPVDYNTEGFRLGNVADQVRGTVGGMIEHSTDFEVGGRNVAGFLYNTAMSGADSLLSGVIPFGAVALGANATQTRAKELAARGASDNQALAGGIAAGLFEGLFESVTIGNLNALKEIPVDGLKTFVLNIAKSAGVNASEEALTEIANIAFDALALGDVSDWQAAINSYIADGEDPATAKRKAAQDLFGQVIEAAASGALMGIGFGTVGSAQSAAYSALERAAQEMAQNGSISNNTAERIMADPAAMEQLGVDTNGMTKSQTRNAVKDAVAEQNPTQEAASAAENVAAPVQQTTPQRVSESETAHRIQQGERASAALGENGARAFKAAYDETTAATLSAEDAYSGFARVYNAALKGETVESDLPAHMKLAAEASAQKDAALAQRQEVDYSDAVPGLVQNEYSDRLSKGTANILNMLGKATGATIVIQGQVRGGTANGSYHNRVVKIAADADNPFVVVGKHEITHRMQELAPKEYRAFRDYAVRALSAEKSGLVEQYQRNAAKQGENLTREQALDEIAADFTEMLLTDESRLEKFLTEATAKAEGCSMVRKFFDAVREFLNKARSVFNGERTKIDEAARERFGASLRQLEKAERLWMELVNASVAAEKNTADNGGEKYSLSQVEIGAIQSIGRKSVNSFDPNDIAATEKFARRYYEDLGTKSPFFRAWFGDWREHDQTPVNVVSKQGDTRTDHVNKDTGWTIKNSGKIHNEVKAHHSIKSREAVPYLPYIDEIIKSAVLLDTEGVGKKKSENSLLMHYLYAVADIGNGPEVLKLTVEEMYNPNSKGTDKRAYSLHNIEKAFVAHGGVQGNSPISRSNATNAVKTVSDLFALVKQMDSDFSPADASKITNADGTPKVMYHGSPAQFTVFDKKKAKSSGLYGRGFYFSDSDSHAGTYGNTYSVYLNIRNPLHSGGTTVSRDQVRGFLEAVAENEDYSIENYGTYDVKKVLDNIMGQDASVDAFKVIQDVSLTAVGDMVEAAELFNSVNGTDFDGIVVPTETVAFRPEQIKSATDNVGTFDKSNHNIFRSLKGQSELLRQAAKDAQLAGMIKQYGTIPAGENPAREVSVPRRTSDDKKVSQTVRTIMEAGATPDEALPNIEQMIADEELSYEVYGDDKAVSEADGFVRNLGWDAAQREWFSEMGKGVVSKRNTTLGWMLYNNAVNSGKTALAMDILNEMVKSQRNAAQALQATRILKKLSPETQLFGVQRSVANLIEDLKKRYGDKAPNLTIDQGMAERFLRAKTDKERAEAMQEIYRDIGRQMPSTFMDKFNAWRYLAMLGNTRTHVRNIMGNLGFAPVVAFKNLTAAGIERLVLRQGRTKSVAFATKEGRALLKAAWDDYTAVADSMPEGKYSDLKNANKYIEEGRVIFTSKLGRATVERARRFNSKALSAEDAWFSRPHYASALAQYCKTNGISVEAVQKGKGVRLEAARRYAMKEAQKATYQDANAFSEFFSRLGRSRSSNKWLRRGSMLVEGVLPFRKTPANILVRSVEYSPLGLAHGIKLAVWDVQRGNATAAEAIDRISAGLTGSALLGLGLWMAAAGLVRGHGDDEKEKEKNFSELQGHQAYALELPNGTSVTLDWLAPEALPFFIGVNFWEMTSGMKDAPKMEDWLRAVGNVSEPLLEMSCLQGLNSLLDSVGYASSEGLAALPTIAVSAATILMAEVIPTLFGQIERTGEDVRMTTYTDKNKWLDSDTQYFLGKVTSKIPGIDYAQIPYIDAWGRTEVSGGPFERAFNNFLNPAYMSEVNVSEMEKELERLYKATGETGVLPSRAAKSFTVNGEEINLTGEQYVEYATYRGQRAYQLITELTECRFYSALSDAEKQKAVEKCYEVANEEAKSMISEFELGTFHKHLADAEAVGISNAEYIVFYKTVNSIKGEDRAQKIRNWLKNSGFTRQQKEFLWSTEYKGAY